MAPTPSTVPRFVGCIKSLTTAARRWRSSPTCKDPKFGSEILASPTVRLETGAEWHLDQRGGPGDANRVSVSVPGFAGAARPGDPILLGDGNVELVVERANAETILARVVHGGIVASQTGLFLPRAHLRTSVVGLKDRRDLRLAVSEGVDYAALSFVRDASDVRLARRLLDRLPGGAEVGIIAKIERAEALERIDEILEAANGIMVARGDLGIEVPLERLALEQKMLVRKANRTGKLVIVATQMLLSMITSPRPTRAEATDVANAVLDGTDALMLSEESAVGEYPFDAVQWLSRIAEATEGAIELGDLTRPEMESEESARFERSVAAAAVRLATDVDASAIVTPTHSGRTARLVARLRPKMQVLALSSHATTRRQLALVWGVEARRSPDLPQLQQLRAYVARIASDAASKRSRQPVVLTAGFPLEGRPTNLVTLVEPAPGEGRAPRSSRPNRRRSAP